MTSVGIYVDGPNMERSLYDSREMAILDNIGSLLVEYAASVGSVAEGRVYVDESTIWRSERTKEDYLRNGFQFVESKSFKHLDPHTHSYVFGKSLTDPSMYCSMVDRLHDPDCPDVLVVVTGDKDATVVLDYIRAHGKRAHVLGEANSLSGFLVSKCDSLQFPCHVIQLVARSSETMRGRHIVHAKMEGRPSRELEITDVCNRPISVHKYIQYRNDRSNQLNPNNIAYWRSRGFAERPPDWERRVKEEKEDTKA